MNHTSGLNKRLSKPEGDDHLTKKRKKGFMDSSGKQTSGLDAQHSEKKLLKDKFQIRTNKLGPEEDEVEHRKVSTLPPFQELVDPNDSDTEDQSTKSDVSRISLCIFQMFKNQQSIQFKLIYSSFTVNLQF